MGTEVLLDLCQLSIITSGPVTYINNSCRLLQCWFEQSDILLHPVFLNLSGKGICKGFYCCSQLYKWTSISEIESLG
jgi:hypothetical protein